MPRVVRGAPKKHVVCPYCKRTISYEPLEVRSRTVHDYRGDSDRERFITCPTPCKKAIVVS